jgi:hypothetical protein
LFWHHAHEEAVAMVFELLKTPLFLPKQGINGMFVVEPVE